MGAITDGRMNESQKMRSLTAAIHTDNEALANRLFAGGHPMGVMAFQLQVLQLRFQIVVDHLLSADEMLPLELKFEQQMQELLLQMEVDINKAKLLQGLA